MGHKRFNSQTGDHSDYVHWCPTCIPVSIVSELAQNEPAVSQDRDRSILESRPVFWRWSVHRSEWIKAAQLSTKSGRYLYTNIIGPS